MDPLSISASIAGLLQTVKSLYGFIDSISGAPETLTRAGDDLKSTDGILEDLHRYLGRPPQALPAVQPLTDQKSALSSVLPQFKNLCNDFHRKLESCVRHSAGASKLSWTDRVMTVLKKGSIEKFQAEVSKARQILTLRVDMIALLNTEQNTASIHDFQRRNDTSMKNILQQIADLHITMKKVQELSDESSEVLQNALRDQEAMLKEQLLLCDENRAAADAQARYELEYGNTKVEDNARNLRVLDLDKAQGSFKLKYGNLEIGNGSWSAEGAMGADMMERFFYGPAASQSQNFRGAGRRVGGNVVGFSDVQSGSAPRMKR